MLRLQMRKIPMSSRLSTNCINDSLLFGHKVQQLLCYDRLYQINGWRPLHSLKWHPNLPKGKIRILLDNMKYTKEK